MIKISALVCSAALLVGSVPSLMIGAVSGVMQYKRGKAFECLK